MRAETPTPFEGQIRQEEEGKDFRSVLLQKSAEHFPSAGEQRRNRHLRGFELEYLIVNIATNIVETAAEGGKEIL